ncbi:MAG: SUF system NifU family Fe-S cluster assembly protein [Betaproteobacteria bacterium]|nr:SUF system NifU family Fe-S cluster assembly protein [Betaproteobacteria bacterium]
MNPPLRDLYEQVILEHNRHPRHYPENPPGSNRHAHGFNPLCNDEVSVHLQVEDGVVRAMGFEGAGCAVAMASASMMAEAVQGKTLDEVQGLFVRVHAMLAQDGPEEGVGKLKALAGVKAFPMRVKCATLAWHTLQAALENRPDTVTTEDPAPVCPQPGTGP